VFRLARLAARRGSFAQRRVSFNPADLLSGSRAGNNWLSQVPCYPLVHALLWDPKEGLPDKRDPALSEGYLVVQRAEQDGNTKQEEVSKV